MKQYWKFLLSTLLCVMSVTSNAEPNDQTNQTSLSNDGLFEVTISSELNPLRLGQLHAWNATLKTPDGKPITHAKIIVGGGMPVHNHGFPTAPRVTSISDDGVYRIEGIKFSMRGPWILLLDITVDDVSDSIGFNIDM